MSRNRSGKPRSIAAVLLTLLIGLVTAYFQGFNRTPDSHTPPPHSKTERTSSPSPSDQPSTTPIKDKSRRTTDLPRQEDPSQADASLETMKGFVSHVKDGDSLVLQVGNQEKEVRLWGIDAPEGNTRQPFAENARAYARELCQRKNITLVVHDRDQYGRIVGEAILPDKTSVNEQMIAAGWAWHFRRHAGNRSDFARAEQEARQQGKGLWQDPDPVPPWDWRREHRPKD